ncbi:GNAT family N-acetyltransferase [Lactobacillus sp. LC28-10]|uniref:GNAT family N-acetyltransferase n=1 Tax=Secundilactobacillus angelensis TaxID=2722706 RepID=A0ABX1KX07_9LACO|nr:GNAT family N-acetyltransferase [Secundilactobacillus angelensis]MCH5462188.1 GNAT family N-acetyltransferase [Secundilactobacillus angelensis]NLR18479.1 GNAT family N-acetyltransferase [Secundilactobacillus angelensis]
MQTLANQLSNQLAYDVRELTHDDEDDIYQLQKQHQQFFDLFLDHQLTKREATSDLDEVASEASAAQKHYLGLFKDGKLVATIDLTIDYPLPQLVWLGQYFVDDSQISANERTTIINQILAVLKQLTAVQVQLLVLKADQPSRDFYENAKFELLSETRTKVGQVFMDALIYQKTL